MSRWLLLSLLLLVGCSAAPAARPSTSDPPAAATDVMFLQMLLPHHRQGVELAGLGRTRGTRTDLTLLAAAIESTQRDEVETMSGWLREAGAPETAPPATDGADPHAAHGGLPGTSAVEIAALHASTGTEFERRFLTTMMSHQGDAIRLAKMELASGKDPRIRAFATRIELSRVAQLEQMQHLLDTAT
ncbi:DUF305 domain-containing protein [Phytohabitans rumicis]|uniref:DUF305 domain-containing protein n=1 Tax=Phytohabitans rumicis TaxID=1076125 RepID=A0A6V8LAP9_9ACTN|nr:DUF305 domain-containing protein [Phytohabitans rumicis]GFJ94283.1 DUF305 domain-containing protein [Phytohabitans rumicis]